MQNTDYVAGHHKERNNITNIQQQQHARTSAKANITTDRGAETPNRGAETLNTHLFERKHQATNRGPESRGDTRSHSCGGEVAHVLDRLVALEQLACVTGCKDTHDAGGAYGRGGGANAVRTQSKSQGQQHVTHN
jgi:hypothetical protein